MREHCNALQILWYIAIPLIEITGRYFLYFMKPIAWIIIHAFIGFSTTILTIVFIALLSRGDHSRGDH